VTGHADLSNLRYPQFRLAEAQDEDILLSWRNNPNVKKYSRSNQDISSMAHKNWFNLRLLDLSNEPILIFQFEGKKIGMTRLDTIEGTISLYEISVLVSEDFQGRGFATNMVAQSLNFASKNLQANGVIASIHRKNLASIRLFTKLSFEKISDSDSEFEEYAIYF